MKNFAITGVAGYVAPRHLKAIHDTGNRLVAALDPRDAVGVLDRFSFATRFFLEPERFDRFIDKLQRGPDADRVHYLSVCSPNYLHDAHIRLALRAGADVICEKPLVINPWNLDALADLERESGRRVATVLQLRLHPSLLALHDRVQRSGGHHDVTLDYVTARGPWYDVSWKGSEERSGGLATNIGIHLFDMLVWIFGAVESVTVTTREPRRLQGELRLRHATVRWFLSVDIADLPGRAAAGRTTFRAITIDGEEVEFTDGFADLHTQVYAHLLDGKIFGIEDARPAIELAHRIRKEKTRG